MNEMAAILLGIPLIAIGAFIGFIYTKLPSIVDGFNVFNEDWDELMED